MRLSVIVPSLTGHVPASVLALRDKVQLVVVTGVSPVAEARNAGIRQATGDYIAWVDADDEITDEWLPSILAAINPSTSDVNLLFPDLVTFDVCTQWHDGSHRPDYLQRHRTADFARDYLRGNLPGQLWCKVFKAELFRGRHFAGACYEDTRMMSEILRDCHRRGRALSVVDIPNALYVYRRRADGLSQMRRIVPTVRSLLALSCQCWCCDMLVGLLRLWWDFAKMPIRLAWRFMNQVRSALWFGGVRRGTA